MRQLGVIACVMVVILAAEPTASLLAQAKKLEAWEAAAITPTVMVRTYQRENGQFVLWRQGAGVMIGSSLNLGKVVDDKAERIYGAQVLTSALLFRDGGQKASGIEVDFFLPKSYPKPSHTFEKGIRFLAMSPASDIADLALLDIPIGSKSLLELGYYYALPCPPNLIPAAPSFGVAVGCPQGGKPIAVRMRQVQKSAFAPGLGRPDPDRSFWMAEYRSPVHASRNAMMGGPLLGGIPGKKGLWLMGMGSYDHDEGKKAFFLHAKEVAEFLRPHIGRLDAVRSEWDAHKK